MPAIPILASGQSLSMNDISTALGLATSVQRSINQTEIRGLAEKTTANSQIGYSDLVGKLGTFYISDTRSIGTASASITFNTDGTITLTGNLSGSNDSWYKPTTANIGNNYWIKAVLATGTGWSTGITADTVLQLNTARAMTWSRSTVGLTVATVNVFIYSNSGGTNLVAKGYLDVDVDRI